MTERELLPLDGWPAVGTAAIRRPDPFADWYEVWRMQQCADRGAEEAQRARMRREIRWLSGLIASWSLVLGGAAALAIWIVL